MRVSVVNSAMTVSVGTMQLTLSIAIWCRIWGSIAIMLVVLSAIPMLVDLFVAFMKVTVFVAIMQLEVSATSSENFHRKYVSDNFNWNYGGGCLCCKHAGGIFSSASCTKLFLL